MLVDVREPHEYEAGHLPEAVNIPLIELDQTLENMEIPRELYFICHSGSRSSQAYHIFRDRLESASIRWIQGGMREIQV